MTLPQRTDVAIIGAGFAGAATAAALAAQGVRDVVVLEREQGLGRFASGRGAGLGRQLAEDDATTELTVRGAERLRGTRAWAPTGGVLTFDDREHAETYVARAGRFGVAVERIDRAAVLARWPELFGLAVASALHVPSDGTIAIATHLEDLAAAARIVLGAGVVRAEAGRVHTTLGTIDARVIVDAAGAWAGEATATPPLAAFKRHLYVLDARAQAGAPWLWHVGAGELYVRADAGGVLASPCDATHTPAGAMEADATGDAALATALATVAPAFASAPVARRWACQRAFAPDRQMRLGRDPDRPWLVWAAALGGHGATASLAVGERVAAAVIAALT